MAILDEPIDPNLDQILLIIFFLRKRMKKLNKFDLLGIKYGLAPDPKNPGQCIYKLLTQYSPPVQRKSVFLKPK
jgi:hypothetical protein